MKIVQITPGAGGMYCGGCFRDNALVAALRKAGHETLMIPLYLPLTLDEENQAANTPIFFSGVNVYLEQKFPGFRHAPQWLRTALASKQLLKLLGRMAGKTRAEDVGELTISMLRGEEGNQAREVDELVSWLKTHHRPDVISLSNVLLVGMARRLKAELNAPIVCMLQGEDTFLDGLPAAHRDAAWQVTRDRARDVDLFIAPSRYFGEVMTQRLQLPPDRVRVVHNGINLDGFETRNPRSETRNPTVGYFARMCRDKGLPLAVDTFIELRQRGGISNVQLHIGGGCGPSDEPVVEEQKQKLARAGLLDHVRWFPNVTRDEKIAFMLRLDVFCTPALYGEAFGLYVLEALGAGVPVVQPRHAAFPEVVEATGGGIIAEPNAAALAGAIESLLKDLNRARELGTRGQRHVREHFNVTRMATETAAVFESARALVNRKS